jgi:hypothetical protein
MKRERNKFHAALSEAHPRTGTFLELPKKRDRLRRAIVVMSVPDLLEF